MRWRRRRFQRIRRRLRKWFAYGFPTREHLAHVAAQELPDGLTVLIKNVNAHFTLRTKQ